MEATATQPKELRPLRLVPTDYLGVDWSGGHFVMRARSLTSNPAHRTVGNTSRYLVNGIEMHDHWAAPSDETSQFFNTRLMEAKWDKKNDVYNVAATDSNAVITLRSWPRDRIVFVSDERVSGSTSLRRTTRSDSTSRSTQRGSRRTASCRHCRPAGRRGRTHCCPRTRRLRPR